MCICNDDGFDKLLKGYCKFRMRYIDSGESMMEDLHLNGQSPEIMVVSCCDSRVDPALLLQCEPGDLFTVRNIANIIPPYEHDSLHHGTSAALEFGINVLNIKHLIILGHSQCSGIKAWLDEKNNKKMNLEFIGNWVSIIDISDYNALDVDSCAQLALLNSYNNCLTFPWIKNKVDDNKLYVHLWFFDIKSGQILSYDHSTKSYIPLLCSDNLSC